MTCELSYRIMRAFEQVASFYAWQIPENASQIINLTSTVLVTERVSRTCYHDHYIQIITCALIPIDELGRASKRGKNLQKWSEFT